MLWIAALAIDYTGPLVTYRVPFLPPLDRGVVGGPAEPLRRALPAVRDHRPGRVDRPDRGDDRRARPRHWRTVAAFAWPSWAPRRSGGCTSTHRRGDGRATPRGGRRTDADGARRLHLPARGDRRGDHRHRGRRRAGDRAPDRGARPRPRSIAIVAGPALYLLAHVAAAPALSRHRSAGRRLVGRRRLRWSSASPRAPPRGWWSARCCSPC